jgi:4-oxalocrotonate tautomerase
VKEEENLMPMIRVEMFAGRTSEQKQRLAEAITSAFVETCGGTPQSVQVIFSDIARSDWATAGKLNDGVKAGS